MESSIAGMIILGVLIVAVVLMSRAYVVSNTLLGTAMVESVNLAEREGQDRFVHRVLLYFLYFHKQHPDCQQ